MAVFELVLGPWLLVKASTPIAAQRANHDPPSERRDEVESKRQRREVWRPRVVPAPHLDKESGAALSNVNLA